MEIILLALIAGILMVRLVNDSMGSEDPVLLIVAIPMLTVTVLVAAGVVLGVAWGSDALLKMFGFYL